jgi:two-component system, NarL family, sensor kinase
VLQSSPIANCLPESIIQYVIRTHEPVILNDATHEGNFIHEQYIQHNQPKSLLCLPLLNQTKLVGVLYLENQLATGVFTPDRSQVLYLLSTQAAIAIENARLYSKLQSSKNLTAQFLEAVYMGIGVVDAAGRPYYVNQRGTQLLGKGVDPAVTSDQLAEIYQLYSAGTDQSYPKEKMPMVRALSGERTRVDDIEIRQNDKIISVEAWGTPIFDEQGNVIYAISAFQDITERKQSEAALRESEARYRLLFENNPNPMWIYDAQTLTFLAANDAAIQYYGYSLDEFLNMTILDIRPSDDVSKLLNHMSRVRDLPYTHSGEWQHCKKDGSVIDVEITSRAIIWAGIAARCVLMKDITERKRTEQLLAHYNRTLEQQVAERTTALQESEVALRDREQELRLITDALPVCIFYTDLSQRYRFINHACEIWFNCSRNEILGRRNRDLLGEAAYHVVKPYIKQVLTGQSTSYEAEIAYPSGNKHISAIYIPDFDRNAQVRGYYGLILDISDRKRAEEASILEERNRMAREIHDTLAQSFTGILVQIGAAMQVLSDDAEATQSHLEIIDELARIGLAEARRSVTALRPQLLEEGDLHSALHRLVTQMRATADTALIYEITGIAYPLSAEVENNLFRIGQEALTNAIKYANANEIRVELAYKATQCSLCIKDDGIGFGVGSIPSIGGFGLLGISERAERIGAQLTIHSQPGQGTEIIIIVNQPGELS